MNGVRREIDSYQNNWVPINKNNRNQFLATACSLLIFFLRLRFQFYFEGRLFLDGYLMKIDYSFYEE